MTEFKNMFEQEVWNALRTAQQGDYVNLWALASKSGRYLCDPVKRVTVREVLDQVDHEVPEVNNVITTIKNLVEGTDAQLGPDGYPQTPGKPYPMNKGQLLFMLAAHASEYVTKAVENIKRNNHMNEVGDGLVVIEQRLIDALIVDFINFVGVKGGVDFAMYTTDLAEPTNKGHEERKRWQE